MMTYFDKTLLLDQAEIFVQKARANLPEAQRALVDALVLIQLAKEQRIGGRDLVSALRAGAIKTRRDFPVLTAHFEILADGLDKQLKPLNSNERDHHDKTTH